MSRSHPNIGTKRSYEGDQADEDTNEQFAHVANMQTKLVHTEKALKNLSAPAARLEAQATEALADPAVYLELEQTRRQHDALVIENAKLKQQVQPPSKQITDLLDANKKLRTDLLSLQSEHRKLELQLQNAEQLMEVVKNDALASRQQCQSLSEENNSLSSQVFVLEHMQQMANAQSAAAAAQPNPAASSELQQSSEDGHDEEARAKAFSNYLEQFSSGAEPDVTLTSSPVLQVDED